ncbi:hypothetical protein FACS189427_09700 [Planctomycetales bacterium]|nr:hypothetical protein FACS189427_09700 [Planctomycetales bacterium]
MSRKIVCLLLASFIALAAVNFAAAEEKVAVVPASAAPCDCAGPVVYAPAPVVYAPAPYWRPLLHHRYYAPVYAPVCDPYPAPVFYRRGLLGHHYYPVYGW